MTWQTYFEKILKWNPLPEPRIVRSAMRSANL